MSWNPLPVKEIPVGGFRGLNEDISPTLRPLGSLSSVSNLILSPRTVLATRPGLTVLGSPLAAAVTRGIHQFRNVAGTTVQTLAQAGAQLSYSTGGAWTSISAAMPSKNFQAANLNDYACLFWAGSAPQKWSGAALTAIGGAPPQGEFVVEAYEQLFVAGVAAAAGDVYFCDDGLPEVWTPASTNNAGQITLSENAIKWVGFDQEQGKVLFWTARELVVLNGPETPNRPNLWAVRTLSHYGTPNGRTVQNLNGTWIWLTNSPEVKGFAMWGGGGITVIHLPIKVSLGLIDWANIANSSSWQDAAGRYNCSVPKTGGGTLWFIYDPELNEWFMGTGASMRASGVLTASGQDYFLVGSDVGQIYKATGTDDAGTAIPWSCEIGPSSFGDPFHNKQITELILVVSAEAGATINASVALSESGSFGTVKSITAATAMSHVPVPLPVASGDGARSGVFRIKLNGTGVVEIHDIQVKAYYSGR